MGAHYERARMLYRQGRYVQAERELREELAQHPHWGQAHAFLGRCLARQNRMPEAVEECEEGVRLSPDLPYAHYMLGLTFLDLNRLEKAEAAMREALRLDPRDPDLMEWLSWVQFQRGDRHGAAATANQGLAIDPQHVGCLNRRGFYLRWLGYWGQSEEALRAALKLDPENAYTHANLGWTLYSKAHGRLWPIAGHLSANFLPFHPNLPEARKHFLEALRLDPASDWAKTGAAETLLVRYRAMVQPVAAILLFGTGFLGLATHRPAQPADPGADPDPFAMGMILLLGAGLVVLFANGPAYVAMRLDRLGAALLSPARRTAAALTVGCLAVAAGAAVAAALTPPPTAFAVLFVSLALIRPLTIAREAAAGTVQMLMTAYACVLAAAGLGMTACICTAGQKEQAPLCVMLLVGGLFGSIFSAAIARDLAKQYGKKTG